jgi:HAD superfamily hydrolase (TIGR01509 family)
LAEAALKRNGIIKYFSFIISCDEVGVGKNKPDIFYLAANKLNAKPSEIAVYEDADFALITAKEAGFYTIGVYDDYFKNARKDIELISDIYIESFKELL